MSCYSIQKTERLGLTKAEGAGDSEWCVEEGCGVRNMAGGQGTDAREMLTFSLCCASPAPAQLPQKIRSKSCPALMHSGRQTSLVS